jgi:hypothetical protein
MNSSPIRAKILAALLLCTFVPFQTQGAIKNVIRDVKEELEQLDRAKPTGPADVNGAGPIDSSALSEKLAVARRVIDEGEHAIDDLNAQIDKLDKEKMSLQQVQTALTSGLIGAIVTAIVAIAGVIIKTLSSRVDKDIKRLGVVEKIAELSGKGIRVPADIIRTYEMKQSTGQSSTA